MEAGLPRDLRVEADAEQVPLLHSDHASVRERGEHLGALSDGLDHGSADERGLDRLLAEGRDVELCLERLDLTAEGVRVMQRGKNIASKALRDFFGVLGTKERTLSHLLQVLMNAHGGDCPRP